MRIAFSMIAGCALLAVLPLVLRGQQPPALPPPGGPEESIRLAVDLVSFPLTVTDQRGRFIADLDAGRFRLLENGIPQQIAVFQEEPAPLSMGIVLDTSGSMEDKLPSAVAALERFVRTIRPHDDVFLLRFAAETEMLLDFTSDRRRFDEAVRQVQAAGGTALYDAVSAALRKLKEGRHRKRALLVITDGADNESSTTLSKVLQEAKAADALVYCLGVAADPKLRESRRLAAQALQHGAPSRRLPGRRGTVVDPLDMPVLERISKGTGGRSHLVARAGAELDSMVRAISAELREQYTVGYYPANRARDGEFRKIKLESDVPGARLRYRAGYYAPKE